MQSVASCLVLKFFRAIYSSPSRPNQPISPFQIFNALERSIYPPIQPGGASNHNHNRNQSTVLLTKAGPVTVVSGLLSSPFPDSDLSALNITRPLELQPLPPGRRRSGPAQHSRALEPRGHGRAACRASTAEQLLSRGRDEKLTRKEGGVSCDQSGERDDVCVGGLDGTCRDHEGVEGRVHGRGVWKVG